MAVKVLLVDDHALFMEGLKNLLIANGIEVVGMAMNSQEALRKTTELLPEVILMDVQMPDCDGIEATRIIKAQVPEVKIVMLTVSQDDNHLFEAIKAGASGYLLKGLPKEKFLELLMELNRGESPLSPGLATKVLKEFAQLQMERELTDRPTDNVAILSSRQIEILNLVAQGFTYKEIGIRVHLSEGTIKYHVGEITNRLHMENRTQAVALASRMGLISNEKNNFRET
jgi:DNA-binding NarL/FixJ family response regulator